MKAQNNTIQRDTLKPLNLVAKKRDSISAAKNEGQSKSKITKFSILNLNTNDSVPVKYNAIPSSSSIKNRETGIQTTPIDTLVKGKKNLANSKNLTVLEPISLVKKDRLPINRKKTTSLKSVRNFFSKLFSKKQQNDTLNKPIDIKTTNISTPLDSISSIIDSINGVESSQKAIQFLRKGDISTVFNKKNITLQSSDMISNVMKVVNHGNTILEFKMDLLLPANWTRIDRVDKQFKVNPKDTIIVPILISPTKMIRGNTEIFITTFLLNNNEELLTSNYFTIKTTQKKSWKVSLSNQIDMYFKNGEISKELDFSIINDGNHKLDLFLSFNAPKNNLLLKNSKSEIINSKNTTVTLEAGDYKDFNYQVEIYNFNKRNINRISLNTYNPNQNIFKKNYSFYLNSKNQESTKSNSVKRTKINFIKLPKKVNANVYGYPYLPITLELTGQNILNDKSFLSLNLSGIKQLNKESSIVYNAQMNYSNAGTNQNVFKNTPWYIGYFDANKTIEIGQISGNLLGIASAGKGIKGTYQINAKNQVGAFYVNSLGFINNDASITIGGSHLYRKNKNFQLISKIGRNTNNISNRAINIFSIQPTFKIKNKHNFNLTGAVTNKSDNNTITNYKANGFLWGTNYSSNYLKKKWTLNIGVNFNDKHFNFNRLERLAINHRTLYKINHKWAAQLSNTYQGLSTFTEGGTNLLFKQKFSFNNLIVTSKQENGTYQPGLFYEYRSIHTNMIYARGMTFRYSNFQFKNNLMSSLFVRAGYTKIEENIPNEENYFNLELSSLLRFKTWNLTSRYNYGVFSSITSQATINDFKTPQSIRIALQNQYALKNRHYVIETNGIYSYNNIFTNHTFSLFPSVFYFTNSGWRFGMGANYMISSSNFNSVFDTIDTMNSNDFRDSNTRLVSNFNLNFTLRKQFGIPIPYMKSFTVNTSFVSFMDINGNGVKDKDEDILQNVVIKVDDHELLTDTDGKATITNIEKNTYKIETFSLEKLNGWFPNVNDSIRLEKNKTVNIPFVRGVKVYGDVVLNRQKIAVSDKSPIDLSRIKISASNGKLFNTLTDKKGHFEFYLPYGDYIITMDEQILNNTFSVTYNNIPLNLKDSESSAYISFYIIEKRRKVIFKNFTKKQE